MKSGYHQILEVNKEKKTAFTVGPFGLYKHNFVLFGFTKSSATGQPTHKSSPTTTIWKFVLSTESGKPT